MRGANVREIAVASDRIEIIAPSLGDLPAFVAELCAAMQMPVYVEADDGRWRLVDVGELAGGAFVLGDVSGYEFNAPGVRLALPLGIKGTSPATLLPDGSVDVWGGGRLWPIAQIVPSRRAGGAVVGAAGDTAALDARSRSGALALTRTRWNTWTTTATPALQQATSEALVRLEQSDATSGYGIYRRAFDEAINLSAVPGSAARVEELAGWADTRVSKQRDLRPWPESCVPWSSTGFDPLADVSTRPPVSWFPRSVAWFLTLQGNPDVVRDPTLAAELAAAARDALASRWARDESTFTPATVGNFYEWLIRERVPARATKTREWLALGAKTAGYVSPTPWEGLEEVARRTAEDLHKLEPPGGFGLAIGLGIVGAAAVAAWRLIPRSP